MINICIPYGYRADIQPAYEKSLVSWMSEGRVPCVSGGWQAGYFHHSRARNLAVAQGSEPWVLIVDADMIPEPGALAMLEGLTLIQPACYNLYNWRVPDSEWPNRTESSPPLNDEVAQWLTTPTTDGWEDIWNRSRSWSHNVLYGPSLLPRSAYEAVGGQHEGFVGWGAEDDDFFTSLRKAGIPLLPAAGPRFIQAPHYSTRLIDMNRGPAYSKNVALYHQRHP